MYLGWLVLGVICSTLPSSLGYTWDRTTSPWALTPDPHIGSGTTQSDTGTERGKKNQSELEPL